MKTNDTGFSSGEVTMNRHETTDIESLKKILATLFGTYPDGFFLLSFDGRILNCNDTLSKMTGYNVYELNSMNAGDLFTDDMFGSILKSLCKNRSPCNDFRMEGMCARKDNSVFPVELTMKRIETDGSMAGYVFVRDISRECTIYKENQDLRNRLSHEHTMETIGQLAGGISHYFNNVFTGILGNLNLAEIDAPEKLAPLIRKAAYAADRARSFTRQLLSMSRKSKIVLEPVDVRAIIEDVEMFANLSFDRRIDITVAIADPLQGVMADAASLHHVLLNLCVNARDAIEEKLKHTPEMSEPRIKIEACNETVTEHNIHDHHNARTGRFVRISVSDTGCGIDEDTRKRMFEPFFTTKEQGTGLGLSTAHETIQQHGGWIEVSSKVGRGSVFSVYLPVTALKKKMIGEVKICDLPEGSETLLFVDDEEIIQTFSIMALERLGYTVFAASDGKEALDVFIRERERIDLIVLDIMLPLLSGKEVLEKIRLIDREIKVILTSGQEFERYKNIFNEFRALDYIQKPFTIADLALSVRDVLDRA